MGAGGRLAGVIALGVVLGPSAINYGGVDSPPGNGFVITPNDNADLSTVTRAIYVGVSGDIEVIYAGNDADIVLHGVPVGRYSGRFRRVKAAGTTATNLVGEY